MNILNTGGDDDSQDYSPSKGREINPADMNVTFDSFGKILKIDRFTEKTIDPYKKNKVDAVKSNEPLIVE